MNDAALLASPLFRGATSEEIAAMLPCLGASPRRFARGERILRAGEPTRYMGLVLTGSVLVEHTDLQGAVTLLGRAEPGELFAEAYACASDEPLLVDVVASEACEVLFLDARRILTQCTSTCEHHSRIIRNLVGTLAHKKSGAFPAQPAHRPAHHSCAAAVLPRRAGAAGGEPQLYDPVRPPAACRLSECGTQRAVQ